MMKIFYVIAVPLLIAVVLLSSQPASAGDVYLEKHGKLAKRTAARKRAGYKTSSRVSSGRARTVRLKKTSHLSKNALHKETKSYSASGAFGTQRGSLPWPVASRKIIMHFGLQPYNIRSTDSTMEDKKDSDVQYDNLGIVIDAGSGAEVRSVLDGVVDDVMDIGDGVAVLIKHGNYFIIYSDLGKAMVVKGQQISTGEVLGRVGVTGQLDFRLYDAGDVWLDPEKWLER